MKERRKQNRTLYRGDGTIAGYMKNGYYVHVDRRKVSFVYSSENMIKDLEKRQRWFASNNNPQQKAKKVSL